MDVENDKQIHKEIEGKEEVDSFENDWKMKTKKES